MDNGSQPIRAYARSTPLPKFDRLGAPHKRSPVNAAKEPPDEVLTDLIHHPGWAKFINIVLLHAQENHRQLLLSDVNAEHNRGALEGLMKVLSHVYRRTQFEPSDYVTAMLTGVFNE